VIRCATTWCGVNSHPATERLSLPSNQCLSGATWKKKMNKMLSYGQFDFVLVVSAPDLSRKESCSTTQGSMDIEQHPSRETSLAIQDLVGSL
jgi:hypothetical protein